MSTNSEKKWRKLTKAELVHLLAWSITEATEDAVLEDIENGTSIECNCKTCQIILNKIEG